MKEFGNTINEIRKHHFNLGEGKNDFGTTTGNAFIYDKDKADKSKTLLNEGQKNDLRNTHYKLGYDNKFNNATTHNTTYVPKNLLSKADTNELSKELKKNNFDFNDKGSLFNNKTIYMTDFTKKDMID